MNQPTSLLEPWMIHAFCAAIFSIGLVGVLIRKNTLVMLMCVELMLNAVNLTFVAFSRQFHELAGQMAVFFVITVAAAESAVGLALVIALFRTLRSVDTEKIEMLRE